MYENVIRIYHGSEVIISEPSYGKGSLRNDYVQYFQPLHPIKTDDPASP